MIEIKKEKNMGQICWPNTGRGESHIPGALHCRSSTCFKLICSVTVIKKSAAINSAAIHSRHH